MVKKIGESLQLPAKINPSDAKLKWSLNDTEINIDGSTIKTVQRESIVTLGISKLKSCHAGIWQLSASANAISDSDIVCIQILGKHFFNIMH